MECIYYYIKKYVLGIRYACMKKYFWEAWHCHNPKVQVLKNEYQSAWLFKHENMSSQLFELENM
jgi:uncharacterized CHY-type Zn-finger protein